MYRYDVDHMKRGGALSTDIVKTIPTGEPAPFHPDNASLNWIKSMSERLSEEGCSSKYLMPLAYTPPEFGESARIYCNQFLSEVEPGIGLVKDPSSGIETNRDCFADTYLHLRSEAMEERTRRLAPYLQPRLPQ